MRPIFAENVPKEFDAMMHERKPGDRARVTTMAVDFQKHNPFMQTLLKRGEKDDVLAVSLFGDRHGANAGFNFSQMLLSAGLMPLGANGGPRVVHELQKQHFLAEFFGTYVVTNAAHRHVPYIGALLGQSHMKLFAVGDKVLGGGVNATSAAPHFTDAMMELDSPELGDFIDEFIERRGDFRDEKYAGRVIRHGEHDRIIIDYANMEHSPILEWHLKDLRRGPSRVIESSNYIPTGRYLRGLADCQSDGAEVRLHANGWRNYFDRYNHSKFSLLPHVFSSVSARRAGLEVQKNPVRDYNHLKFCDIEYPDGERVAYVRSSNLAPLAVGAGTMDIAFRLTDPETIEELSVYRDSRLLSS